MVQLHIGNIAYSVTEQELRALFLRHGFQAGAVRLPPGEGYQASGRNRGYGFVELQSPEEAQRAIAALDKAELLGRPLRVSLARQERRDWTPPRGAAQRAQRTERRP